MLTDEERKMRLIRGIANTQFPKIDEENWPSDYITVTNEKAKNKAVVGPKGKIYPSIVVVDGKGNVKEIGEVETDDQYTADHVEKWTFLSGKVSENLNHSNFYLYVPKGKGRNVVQLFENTTIKYAEIDTWDVKQGQLIIKPYKIGEKAAEIDPVKLMKKQYLRTQDCMKIYLIEGEYFRDRLDIDFTVGGHHWVYPFIPHDEVWIDDAYSDEPREVEYFIAHELLEIKQMRRGMKYLDAHRLANKLEKKLRSAVEKKLAEKPGRTPFP